MILSASRATVGVGPTVDSMNAMGDKISSKQIAIASQVPIIPGVDHAMKTVEEAMEVAKKVGYPVMLKASNGGGGRGIRLVSAPNEMTQAYALAEHYWPGPLTMILEDKGVVSALVNDGSGTLGVRCPDHPLTQAILRQAGVALAAPSANPSDQPSPKTAQEVLDYFDGHIEGIVDGGPCRVGVESTIVDLTGPVPQILREGGIPGQELLDFLKGLG